MTIVAAVLAIIPFLFVRRIILRLLRGWIIPGRTYILLMVFVYVLCLGGVGKLLGIDVESNPKVSGELNSLSSNQKTVFREGDLNQVEKIEESKEEIVEWGNPKNDETENSFRGEQTFKGGVNYSDREEQTFGFIETTSELSQEGYDFNPYNLVDGDYTTVWAEGVSGFGEYEVITFYNHKYAPNSIQEIHIVNGYNAEGNEMYYKNSRVKDIKIEFENGTILYETLKDTNDIQVIRLNEAVSTSEVKTTILSVYPGTKYEDTCLSEITFYGKKNFRAASNYSDKEEQTFGFVETTSELSQEGYDFNSYNLIDGDHTTAWAEGVSGFGENEVITFYNHKYLPNSIQEIHVVNGYNSEGNEMYYKNTRVKDIKIEFQDGTTLYETLNDTNDVQVIRLNEMVSTGEVKITILSVYPGTKYEDTCLSEITFY